MGTEQAIEGVAAAPARPPMKTGVANGAAIGDPRLEAVYRYWCRYCRGAELPCAADVKIDDISAALASHTMVLDVVRTDGAVRFRYRRVGKVFWRINEVEPSGRFLDEVLPTKGGYGDYVVGIYREVTESRRPLYTENLFSCHGHSVPIGAKRVSLPISNDGTAVDIIVAAHVFEYHVFLEYPHYRNPLAVVDGMRESLRVYLSEQPKT